MLLQEGKFALSVCQEFQRENGVSDAKDSNELILQGADGLFGSIPAIITAAKQHKE